MCLSYSNAQTPFSYDDPKPNYVVGKQITPNKPIIDAEGGTFTILPQLSKGLSLDPKTGIISGIPEEEYENNYTITLMTFNISIITAYIEMKGMIFALLI